MDRWLNKIAVITGSASGIGNAIAKLLIQSNIKIIGLDRDVENLKKFQLDLPKKFQSTFFPLHCDVRYAEEVQKSFEIIDKNFGGIDILINSAGILKYGNIMEMDLEEIKETLDTHVLGIVNCTKEAFRSMQDKNVAGHIILMNSINGQRIPPNMGKHIPTTNMYTPSKFAVTAMTEILRQELGNLDTKIKITSISPGLTETSIVPEFLLKDPNVPRLQPNDIAEIVKFALSTPPHVQIHEITVLPLGGIF